MQEPRAPDLLRSLPSGFLGKIWPGQRVFLGLRVCRWLRKELAVHGEAVWMIKSNYGNSQHRRELNVTVNAVAQTLTRFPHSRIVLQWSKQGHSSSMVFLQGVQQAGPANFAGRIIHLDLGGFLVHFGASLAKLLSHCHALEYFNFSRHPLGSSAPDLAQALSSCKRLTHLDLSRNNLTDDGMEHIAAVLARNSMLCHLNLSVNPMGVQGSRHLASGLAHCTALKHLDLSWVGLEAHGAAALSQVLDKCTALTHLDLRSNFHTPAAGEAMICGLVNCCALLALLDLSCNVFATPEALDGLAGMLARCVSLEVLNLKGVNLGKRISTLTSSLAACPRLAHLDLSSNRFGAETAGHLSALLASCERLTSLDLSLNPLQAHGVRTLAAHGLPAAPSLTYLDLSDNDIRLAGAEALAELLPGRANLKQVRLTVSEIGARGEAVLARAVGTSNGVEFYHKVANAVCLDLRDRRWL